MKIDLKQLTALKQAEIDAQNLVTTIEHSQTSASSAVALDIARQKLDAAISAYQVGLRNYDASLS